MEFQPPIEVTETINQYPSETEYRNFNNLPNAYSKDEEYDTFTMRHKGKILAGLIAISFIIFMILFYDSMCIDKKLSAMVPDTGSQVSAIFTKVGAKIPEIPVSPVPIPKK